MFQPYLVPINDIDSPIRVPVNGIIGTNRDSFLIRFQKKNKTKNFNRKMKMEKSWNAESTKEFSKRMSLAKPIDGNWKS